MIFLIIGILVLILSFVIALYTLLRDAKREDEKVRQDEEAIALNKSEVVAQELPAGVSTPPVEPAPTPELVLPQTTQLSSTARKVEEFKPGAIKDSLTGENAGETPDQDVWWAQLNENGTKNGPMQTSEAAEIEEIRAQFDKLIAERKSTIETQAEIPEPDQPVQKKRDNKVLLGEISLSDVRDRD